MKIKVICTIMVVINLVIFYQLINCKIKTNNGQQERETPYKAIKLGALESFRLNNSFFPEITLKRLNSELVSLKNILHNKPSLVMIYSEVSCNSCVDNLIQELNRAWDTYKNDFQIVVIVHSKNVEYIKRFIRINRIKFTLLIDENNILSQKMNLKIHPSIFMLNSESKIVNSYFVIPKLKKLDNLFIQINLKKIKKEI